MRRPSRRLLSPVLPAALLLAVLALGLWLGGHPRALPGAVRDVFVADDGTQPVAEALNTIADDYYRPISRAELVDRSISGAVRSLGDRFSSYFDPKEYRAFQDVTRGRGEQFSGVGMQTSSDPRGLRVVEVIARSPAQRAGIRAGDVIVEVDGRALAGRSSDAAAALIKGKPGTSVALTVLTGRQRRVERIGRQRITVPARIVESKLLEQSGHKLAYVSLEGFVSGAHARVRQAIDRERAAGAEGIVFDLRNNGGGLVDEAQLVGSIFLPEGPIVTLAGRTQGRRTLDATGGAIPTSVPVVVLVNQGTASAAEIVSGALQARRRAKLVGDRTFGKGVFQQVRQLPNGGALDITVGQYFLPNGKNLGNGIGRGAGVQPDVRVPGATRIADGSSRDAALRVARRTLEAQLR